MNKTTSVATTSTKDANDKINTLNYNGSNHTLCSTLIGVIKDVVPDFQSKTFNLSYSEKYKLSDIAALILVDKDKIIIKDLDCLYNYCGNSDLFAALNIKLDGLVSGLQKMESKC
jgi:hypothetical protein